MGNSGLIVESEVTAGVAGSPTVGEGSGVGVGVLTARLLQAATSIPTIMMPLRSAGRCDDLCGNIRFSVVFKGRMPLKKYMPDVSRLSSTPRKHARRCHLGGVLWPTSMR